MRVVNSSVYSKFTSSVNDVHSKLNKAMNKVSSGAAYESAAENPLAYYQGKQIDQIYQDTKSKNALLGDVKNRLYQQEQGAYNIQQLLTGSKTAIQYLSDSTHNTDKNTVQTKRDELLQRAQSMVSNLNSQYGTYYVFGGNDVSTTPFALSDDGSTLTFTHKFTDGTTQTMTMKLTYDKANNSYGYEISDADLNKMLTAMREQGRVDVGYGDISNEKTLLDTYTGGLNVLTGLSSDALRAMSDQDAKDAIKKGLNEGPLGLVTSISTGPSMRVRLQPPWAIFRPVCQRQSTPSAPYMPTLAINPASWIPQRSVWMRWRIHWRLNIPIFWGLIHTKRSWRCILISILTLLP